jgi:hypothetical protein
MTAFDDDDLIRTGGSASTARVKFHPTRTWWKRNIRTEIIKQKTMRALLVLCRGVFLVMTTMTNLNKRTVIQTVRMRTRQSNRPLAGTLSNL